MNKTSYNIYIRDLNARYDSSLFVIVISPSRSLRIHWNIKWLINVFHHDFPTISEAATEGFFTPLHHTLEKTFFHERNPHTRISERLNHTLKKSFSSVAWLESTTTLKYSALSWRILLMRSLTESAWSSLFCLLFLVRWPSVDSNPGNCRIWNIQRHG